MASLETESCRGTNKQTLRKLVTKSVDTRPSPIPLAREMLWVDTAVRGAGIFKLPCQTTSLLLTYQPGAQTVGRSLQQSKGLN